MYSYDYWAVLIFHELGKKQKEKKKINKDGGGGGLQWNTNTEANEPNWVANNIALKGVGEEN